MIDTSADAATPKSSTTRHDVRQRFGFWATVDMRAIIKSFRVRCGIDPLRQLTDSADLLKDTGDLHQRPSEIGSDELRAARPARRVARAPHPPAPPGLPGCAIGTV